MLRLAKLVVLQFFEIEHRRAAFCCDCLKFIETSKGGSPKISVAFDLSLKQSVARLRMRQRGRV